ncbi:MAG TPA: flagellar export protein FliJ [Chloroflexota bacterium]|nr:flagellar export protein FliJ [Chloroflexota bacterium]
MPSRRQFRLEPVLRLRKQRERERQGQLAVYLRQELEQRGLLNQMTENRSTQLQLLSDQLNAPRVEMTYVQFGHAYLERLQALIERQSNVVRQATRATNQRRAELAQAVKERKVIEKLREQWWEALLEEDRQRDIKLLDEVATVQFNQARQAELQHA